MEESTHLAPPQARGHFSVARLPKYWYGVIPAGELGAKPLARTLLGTPLVLFRDGAGVAHALVDRCPHRNVPLSLGRVARTGRLECAYHGWQFDGDGACKVIPSLSHAPTAKACDATGHATRESDGVIWVWGEPGVTPADGPPRLRHVGEPGYTTVYKVTEAQATMHAVIENALDVPHTAFLHKGLFRNESRGISLEVIVRRTATQVEAEYLGEPRPEGFVARVLSPSGGVVQHWDRFILPAVSEVEYRIGDENHLLVSSLLTPVEDFHTRLTNVVRFRSRLPGELVKPFLEPLVSQIFKQDAWILKTLTDTTQRFGGEQYASTEIDLFGKHVWRLLRAAERGATEPAHEERVTMIV
ncbi:MAG: aromatic ring-hydroxylating dioxygenase subunit alpha [Kofleriaceae bacterium]|nr:aromatic ring-hydroxylating dioxygenase subunit alpha [Kofleriaceae bacterium]